MLRGLPTWRGLFIFMAESAFVASFYYRLIIFGSDVNFQSGGRAKALPAGEGETPDTDSINPWMRTGSSGSHISMSPDANWVFRMRTRSFCFHKGAWRYIGSSGFQIHPHMHTRSFSYPIHSQMHSRSSGFHMQQSHL